MNNAEEGAGQWCYQTLAHTQTHAHTFCTASSHSWDSEACSLALLWPPLQTGTPHSVTVATMASSLSPAAAWKSIDPGMVPQATGLRSQTHICTLLHGQNLFSKDEPSGLGTTLLVTDEGVSWIVNEVRNRKKEWLFCDWQNSPAQLLVNSCNALYVTSGAVMPIMFMLNLPYPTGRSFKVSWRRRVSKLHHLTTGVPHGSVLGPLLFLKCTASLGHIIQSFSFSYHFCPWFAI